MQQQGTADFVLRAMTAEDIAGGLRLCRASGWNQLEEDWRLFVESAGSGGLLIERAGKILGTAAYMRYDALAWVAMMLVDPAERGAGLGAQLLAGALAALGDAPCVGLDATPLGEPLYRRFGFVGDYSLARTKATIDRARFPDAAGAARRMLASDLEAVCRRDREVFGADRGRLLASLFERAPGVRLDRSRCGRGQGLQLRTPGPSLRPIGSGGGGGRRHCTGAGDELPLAIGRQGVCDRCAAARRGVARVSEVGGVCGRAPVSAYVCPRTCPSRDSGATVRDMRTGVRVTTYLRAR